MLCKNDEQFIQRAWQLSIILNTSDVDDVTTKYIVGWIHYAEFLFMLISIPIVILCNICIVKSVQMKILHKNVRMFFYYCLAAFYFYQTSRFILFFITFTCLTEDVSVFGPLKIFHIFQEFALMFGDSACFGLIIDRFIATKDPSKYEKQQNPFISSVIMSCAIIILGIFQFLRFIGILPITALSVITMAMNFITLPILVYVYKKNKYYLKYVYTMSLNKKFQIRENLRVCQKLIPQQLASTIFIIGFGISYTLLLTLSKSPDGISLILASVVKLSVQIFFCTTPTFIIFWMEDIRAMMLNFLFGIPINRRNLAKIRKIAPCDERKVYFEHHRNQWGRVDTKT